jgi:hypothetical protein
MDATERAFADPRPGDTFQEFYNHLIYIVRAQETLVAVVEAYLPCRLPQDGRLRVFASRAEFRAAYSHQAGPRRDRPFIRLTGRGADVHGWYEELVLRAAPEAGEVLAAATAVDVVEVLGEQLQRWFEADGLGRMAPDRCRERARELLALVEGAGYAAAA